MGVGEVGAGGGDVEQLLILTRRGVGEVDDVEHLGAAAAGDLHGSHGAEARGRLAQHGTRDRTLIERTPGGGSGGAVCRCGGDGFLTAGKRPCGAAVGAARPPVAIGGLLDAVAVRVGRAVTRAFGRVGHVNTTFLKRTPASTLPRWTTGTGRWAASATVRVWVLVSVRVKRSPEPVTVIRSGT